jgi:hypothetical protein
MAGTGEEQLYGWPPAPLGVDEAPPPWEAGLADAGVAPPVTEPQEVGQPQLDGATPVPADAGIAPDPAAADVLAGAPPIADPAAAGAAAPPPVPAPPTPEPAPPFAPDALASGAVGGAIPGGTGIDTVAELPDFTIRPETHADQYTADPWNNPVASERDAAARGLALSDPVAFEAFTQHLSERKALDAERLRTEAETERFDASKRTLAARQAADARATARQEDIQQRLAALASKKIDTGRWFKNKTTTEKMATLAAAIVGGLVQGRTGGRNVGLDWITKDIDDDINAQKADIENQRGVLGAQASAVGQEFAHNRDLYEAAETARIASYQFAINKLQTQQQNFDPRGTSFANIGRGIQQLVGKQRAAQEKLSKDIWEKEYKVAQLGLQQAKIAEDRRQFADTSARGWATLSSAAADRKQAQEFRQQDKAEDRRLKAEENERELSIGTPPRLQTDEAGKPVLDAAGAPVVETGQLKQKDGSIFQAPDKEARRELATKTVAAWSINDIINGIEKLREEVGGETATFNSDQFQRLKVMQDALVLVRKAGTQGMSSDSDMVRIEGSLGAKDVTTFRKISAGLKEARDYTTSELNKVYRVNGYNGPALRFPDGTGTAAKNTDDDDRLKALIKKPTGDREKSIREEFRRRSASWDPSLWGGATDDAIDEFSRGRERARRLGVEPDTTKDRHGLTDAAYAELERIDEAWNPKLSYAQQDELRRLATVARSGGPGAAAARADLLKVVDQGQTEQLRTAARAALWDSAGSGFDAPPEVR